jgi:hypothetical protein
MSETSDAFKRINEDLDQLKPLSGRSDMSANESDDGRGRRQLRRLSHSLSLRLMADKKKKHENSALSTANYLAPAASEKKKFVVSGKNFRNNTRMRFASMNAMVMPKKSVVKKRRKRGLMFWRAVAWSLGWIFTVRKHQIFRQRLFGQVSGRFLSNTEKRRKASMIFKGYNYTRKQQCENIIRRLVINPRSFWKTMWDLFFTLCFIYMAFRVPYTVAFSPNVALYEVCFFPTVHMKL